MQKVQQENIHSNDFVTLISIAVGVLLQLFFLHFLLQSAEITYLQLDTTLLISTAIVV